MITIRSSKAASKATLTCVEVTLKTARNVYTISSDRALGDSAPSFGDELFGGISWPVSRFRIEEGLVLEQQMFLPHDGSTVAMSWALQANMATAAQLLLRPFFSGCGPPSYRDVGFHPESEDNGGRLTWLPNVRGPRLFVDTNGRYHDEPFRSLGCLCDERASSGSAKDLIAPGHFEFELTKRPAVLILSAEDRSTTRDHQHVGVFLAGLMQQTTSAVTNSTPRGIGRFEIQQPVTI
jgi:glycogen debranching enzyme-like protein